MSEMVYRLPFQKNNVAGNGVLNMRQHNRRQAELSLPLAGLEFSSTDRYRSNQRLITERYRTV